VGGLGKQEAGVSAIRKIEGNAGRTARPMAQAHEHSNVPAGQCLQGALDRLPRVTRGGMQPLPCSSLIGDSYGDARWILWHKQRSLLTFKTSSLSISCTALLFLVTSLRCWVFSISPMICSASHGGYSTGCSSFSPTLWYVSLFWQYFLLPSSSCFKKHCRQRTLQPISSI